MRHPLFPALLIALAWAFRPACGLAEPAPPAKPAAPSRGVLVEKVACAGQPKTFDDLRQHAHHLNGR